MTKWIIAGVLFVMLCVTLLAGAGVWLVTAGVIPLGLTQYKAGDSVTLIKDADVRAEERVVHTLAAGTTVTVKEVAGPLLFVNADVPGWIRAEQVIPLEQAIPYFTARIDSD